MDPAALSEMPSQIMQQDLDPLDGLNIHPSEIESLHIPVVDQVDISSEGNVDPMKSAIPTISSSSDLEDIGILGDGQDFIPVISNDDMIGGKVDEAHGLGKFQARSANVHTPNSEGKAATIVSSGSLQTSATHILKINSGQFIVLQPNQVALSKSSVSQTSLTLNSISKSSSKPLLVNSGQIYNAAAQTPGLGSKNALSSQFRTLQLKQPITLANSNSSTVTKVILSNQPGSNLSQQLRLISSQAGAPGSSTTSSKVSSSPVTNPPKVTFQVHPVALSLPTNKPGAQATFQENSTESNNELNDNEKPTVKMKLSSTLPNKTFSSSGVPQIQSFQEGDVPNKANDQSVIKLDNSNVVLKPGQIFGPTSSGLIKIPLTQLQQLTTQTSSVQNKFNVRLIPTPLASSSVTVIKNDVVAKSSLTPLASDSRSTKTVNLTQINQKSQRFIFPGNAQVSNAASQAISSNVGGLQIKSQGSITLPASALPSGVLSNAQPGSIVMIPAQFLQNSNLTNSVQNSNLAMPNHGQTKTFQSKTVIDANAIKPRKPCNCTKSQCLKLYCDCFANGEFCNNCNCLNCFNNLLHEEERQKAIKCCLERNPQAFRPKIGKGGTDTERRHNKGCNCKRSGCLKNYCECYEAKIPCSAMCRCVGCRNMDSEHPFERKKLMALAEIAEARVNPNSFSKNRQISLAFPSPTKMSLPSSAKGSYCRISQEVVEATCHCLLAQAEKSERNRSNSPQKMEKMVLNEFSHCLLRIIGFNSKSRVIN